MAGRADRLLLCIAAGLCCAAGPVSADDGHDRALLGLAPAAPAVARGAPVPPADWADALRPAARLAPPPLRPVDQAMLDAARTGRWADVLALLKTGQQGTTAHANATDDRQASALVLAAQDGADPVVLELLRRGADPERTGEDGFTPLGAAAYRGQLATLRLLLRAGVDPLRWGATGQGALHLAALAGQTGALSVLLRAGVPIDQLNSQRETALDVAGAAGQDSVMDLLIQGGADLPMAGRR